MNFTKLAAVVACSTAAAAHAEDAPPREPSIVVIGERRDNTPEKLDHILPEVDGTKITVTKKTSVTKLDLVPDHRRTTISASCSRARRACSSPSSQTADAVQPELPRPRQSAGSRIVLLLQDGIPISTDWIGFPTAYYMPLPQSLAEVQLIRGGSSLLYGPNPAPAVNLVSKRPAANQPLGGYTENVVGSDGLFSTYNTVEGSSGKFSARANLGYVKNDGQRDNGASRVRQGDLYLAYRPTKDEPVVPRLPRIMTRARAIPASSAIPQYLANPNQAPTPFNHDWVRRTSLVLGNESDLGAGWRAKRSYGPTWQDLYQRSAAAGAHPASTTLVDEEFRSQGARPALPQALGQGQCADLRHRPLPRRCAVPAVDQHRHHGAARRATAARRASIRRATPGTARSSPRTCSACPGRWHVVPSVRSSMRRSTSTRASGRPTSFGR